MKIIIIGLIVFVVYKNLDWIKYMVTEYILK